MSSPSSPIPPDSELIRHARHGDQQAFRLLYERYAPQVYAFLLGYLGEHPLAEDLTQETFLRVWQALPRYREQGHFRAWVLRIARNLAIDADRARKRRVDPISLPEQISPDESALDPLEDLERRQTIEELLTALFALKKAYRQVLVLRYLLEMEVSEIAQVMGRSEGAVRVLQHRALQALRRWINSKKGEKGPKV